MKKKKQREEQRKQNVDRQKQFRKRQLDEKTVEEHEERIKKIAD